MAINISILKTPSVKIAGQPFRVALKHLPPMLQNNPLNLASPAPII
jgi:hypothetical protein